MHIWHLLLLAGYGCSEIEPIITKGSHFFFNNGTQFFVRGMLYGDSGRQTSVSSGLFDLLGDEEICARDIPYLQRLRINTLLVPHTLPKLDHSACMQRLADAGVYILINVVGLTSNSYFQNGTAVSPRDYTAVDHLRSTIERFSIYPNTLGFYLRITTANFDLLPWYKSRLRDAKEHIATLNVRKIPVGFFVYHDTNASISSISKFSNCGENVESVDFYGVGFQMAAFSLCIDDSILTKNMIAEQFESYSVPSIIELGCNRGRQHNFSEVQTIYGEYGSSVFSGVMVREWLDDLPKRKEIMGLVDVVGAVNISVRPEYDALSSQMALVHPSSTIMNQYEPTVRPPSICTRVNWPMTTSSPNGSRTVVMAESATDLPFTPSAKLCSCMMDTLGCVFNQTDPSDLTIYRKFCNTQDDYSTHCKAVHNNYTTGVYGAYNECNYAQQNSWVLDQLFTSHGRDEAMCNSNGGIIQQPVRTSANSIGCQTFLRQVGSDGTGRVTTTPSPDELKTFEDSPKKSNKFSKVGTEVGVAIGTMVVVGIIIGIFIRHSKSRRSQQKQNLHQEIVYEKAELPGQPMEPHSAINTTELDSPQRYELEGVVPQEIYAKVMFEADAGTEIQQLEGGSNEIVEADGTPKEKVRDEYECAQPRRKKEKIKFQEVFPGGREV